MAKAKMVEKKIDAEDELRSQIVRYRALATSPALAAGERMRAERALTAALNSWRGANLSPAMVMRHPAFTAAMHRIFAVLANYPDAEKAVNQALNAE